MPKIAIKVACLAGASALLMGAAPPARAPAPAPKQVTTGPVAVYWMSAQTTSGMTMGGGGAPQRPSMSDMMAMANGEAPRANYSLILQLGSSQKPAGAPQADHLPPPGLRAGSALPLLTPVRQPAQRTEEGPEQRDFQKPKGRMLIFWGCGEHAGAGQPVVIDFATMAANGAGAQRMAELFRGVGANPMQPPSPTRNATYGEWPNERTRAAVPPNATLAGDHTVRGNYSPEIKFSLGAEQDFLPPFRVTENNPLPSGAIGLGWRPVDGARAYLASAMGGDGDTVVLWVSSQRQAVAFGLPDYLAPGEITRLVGNQTLLPAETTRCAVPAEATRAAPQMIYQLAAYADETNIFYPPKPADPKAAWNIQWQVKVRYRSATGGMLGMEMADAGSGQRQAPGQGQPPAKKKKGFGLPSLPGVPFP